MGLCHKDYVPRVEDISIGLTRLPYTCTTHEITICYNRCYLKKMLINSHMYILFFYTGLEFNCTIGNFLSDWLFMYFTAFEVFNRYTHACAYTACLVCEHLIGFSCHLLQRKFSLVFVNSKLMVSHFITAV